jgi:hypothetical protein
MCLRSRIAHHTWELGLSHMANRKKDDGFTGRALMALATAMADRNYKHAEIIVAALAREHGLGDYAQRVMSAPPSQGP